MRGNQVQGWLAGTRARGIFLAALLAALLFWTVRPAGTVQAHANLLHSIPSAGDDLKTFPTQVRMEFSEAVDPGSISIQLLNSSKKVIDEGTLIYTPANPAVIAVAFPRQPDGLYTVRWQVQSAVDGHITSGTIPFAVGQVGPQVSLLPPPGTPDPADELPSAPDIILRGLGYISVILLAGPVAFGALVWRPAFHQASAGAVAWDQMFTRWVRALVLCGAVLGIASLLTLTAWQVMQLRAFSGAGSFGGNLLSGSSLPRTAWILLARLAVLLSFLGLAVFLPFAGQGKSWRWWLALGLAAVLLATYSLSGHNAAAGAGVLPVLDDWLHVTAMSAWIGGLLPLALLLLRQRARRRSLAVEGLDGLAGGDTLIACATHRFSRVAVTSVITLGISGLYSALLQVQTLAALLGTRYGQALLLKTGLFAGLVGFGALNQRILMPRMARSDARAFRWLGRTVRAEYVLALLLLLVVGALMSLSPAYEALKAEQSMGFHETYREGQVRIDLRVAPARVGENEVGVDVEDDRPSAGSVPPTVLLRIHMLMENMDMGTIQIPAKPAEKNRYTARGSFLTMNGTWQIEVILRKAGFDDVRHVFVIDLTRFVGEGDSQPGNQ